MVTSLSFSFCQFSAPKSSQAHGYSYSTPIWSSRSTGIQTSCTIRCCSGKNTVKRDKEGEKSYYELLGVSEDSDRREIREAYRKLQKKHHPDITGPQGHEYTLQLNEMYTVLMRDDLRRNYDASRGIAHTRFDRSNKNGSGFSVWNGPMRPQGLFVDQNACIGCRECVHYASNTFMMDEAIGSARVKVQFGDDYQNIEVSVESCPVNCIHWVNEEELSVLEFLIQPQPKEGYGIFGGGWVTHKNVFHAAKYFNKKIKNKEPQHGDNIGKEEETPAQAEARDKASKKIRMERLSRVLDWAKEAFWF